MESVIISTQENQIAKDNKASLLQFFKLCDILNKKIATEEANDIKVSCKCLHISVPYLHNVVDHWTFTTTVMLVASLSIVNIVLELVFGENNSNRLWLAVIEGLLLALFGIELALKLLGYGLYFYFSDKWQMYVKILFETN